MVLERDISSNDPNWKLVETDVVTNRRDYVLQDEQDKKSGIKLWDLVKNSTKKLKADNDYSSSPKKAVSKTKLPSSNQNILNSLNISSKKKILNSLMF